MIDFDNLWQLAITEFGDAKPNTIHGSDHWKRVEENGLMLAAQTGADTTVVRLFAIFHDCKRENDAVDPGHGERAAEFISSLRGKSFEIDDASFDLLI